MKDVPHHMQKLMRDLAKPSKTQTSEDELHKEKTKERPPEQIKKQKKAQIRKERRKRTPQHETIDDQNKQMKKRTPRIRDRSHKTTN